MIEAQLMCPSPAELERLLREWIKTSSLTVDIMLEVLAQKVVHEAATSAAVPRFGNDRPGMAKALKAFMRGSVRLRLKDLQADLAEKVKETQRNWHEDTLYARYNFASEPSDVQ
jgi:hypothetical protein